MDNIIRAVRVDLPCGQDKTLDLYKLQNHSFESRIGIGGASESLGYAINWLGRLPKQGAKQWNALIEEGFTGYQALVRVPHSGIRGSSIASTISIRDYNKLLAYEAIRKKNLNAIVLLVSFAEAGIERVIDDALSGAPLGWFGEKIVHYKKWTHEDFLDVLRYNREEVKSLYPWNKEELVAERMPY